MSVAPVVRAHGDRLRILLPQPWLRDSAVASADGAAWTANDAVFIPFVLEQAAMIAQVHVEIVTSNGNIGVAIYDLNGNRLTAQVGTAMGAAGIQTFNMADVDLPAGYYYLGVASSSGSAVLREMTCYYGATAVRANLAGVKKQATAYDLPPTATFAAPTRTTVPIAVLEFTGKQAPA